MSGVIRVCLGGAALAAAGGCADPGGASLAPSGAVRVSPPIALRAPTGFAPTPARPDAWTSAQPGWSAEVNAAGVTVRAAGAAGSFATVAAGGEARLEGRTVVIDRGDVAEEFDAGADGVEQRWRFARAPADGAVRVRVAVEGVRYEGTSPAGLRFADVATGAALRYGHATWVDASGRRTAVPARWTGAAIELTVPTGVVAASTFPAVLDPVIGPEVAVYPTSPGVPAYVATSLPRVAASGATSLAAWSDASGVRVRRLDAAGAALGTADVTVAPEAAARVAVAASPGGWFVAWTLGASVRGARVSTAGAVLDAAPLTLNGTADGAAGVAVAWDGAGWIAVWIDRRNAASTGGDVYGARVASDGRVLDPAGLPIGVLAGEAQSPVVAATAGGYLVAWVDTTNQDVRWARVGRDGATLDPGGVRTSRVARERQSPAVATDGTNFLLAWSDYTSGGSLTPGTYALRVGPAGALDAAPLAVNGYASGVDVAFGGGSYLTTGVASATAIRSQRVSPTGAVLDATPRVVDVGAYVRGASVTPTGAGVLALVGTVAGETAPGPPFSARAVPLAADGAAAGAARPLLLRSVNQNGPRSSFGGGDFLVSWRNESRTATDQQTLGVRVSRAGAALDATARVLLPVNALVTGNPGGGYYAVWTETNTIDAEKRGVRLGADLSVGATARVGFSGGSSYSVAEVAGGPAGHLVTWIDDGVTVRRLNAVTVPAGGAPRPQLAIVNGYGDGLAAAGRAVSRDTMLVVWGSRAASGTPRTCSLLAQLLTPQADRINAAPITVRASTDAAFCGFSTPAAASDGEGWLVVWREGANLQAVRVAADGRTLDATPLRLVAGTVGADRYEVAFDGTDYVVVWRDDRAGGDIYGARVSTAGVVRDPNGFAIAAMPGVEGEPTVSTDGAGLSLVAYTRPDTSGSARAYARVVAFGATSDAGAMDAGSDATADVRDVGVDEAPPDRGVDAGADVDVAPPDVPSDRILPMDGAPDASPADALVVDASEVDVDLADVTPPVDATEPADAEDASAAIDGGDRPPTSDSCDMRCGVGATPARGATGWLACVAVVFAAGRRRRGVLGP